MITPRHALLVPLLLSAAAPAQTLNRNLVFLDPAHGGDDLGAHLDAHTSESAATLALATRLRALLTSGGLTVLMAREPDPPPAPETGATPPPPAPATPTPDQRAGAANHAHPFACILLHATAAGAGVHVVTSALREAEPDPDPDPAAHPASPPPLHWNAAQRTALPPSDRLAAELATALARAGLPTHRSRAAVRPIDSLTCPAVAIELAPVNNTSAADPAYQQRVAQAVATALLFWRGQTAPAPAAPSGEQP